MQLSVMHQYAVHTTYMYYYAHIHVVKAYVKSYPLYRKQMSKSNLLLRLRMGRLASSPSRRQDQARRAAVKTSSFKLQQTRTLALQLKLKAPGPEHRCRCSIVGRSRQRIPWCSTQGRGSKYSMLGNLGPCTWTPTQRH